MAAVKCTVEAEPSHDVTWIWIKKGVDGSEEEVPQENIKNDGLTSSLLVTPLTQEDYGRLLCHASNSVGEQLEPCIVTLVPAGPPDTPTNCSVSPDNASAHANTAALVVTCVEGFDGGLPQHFFLETWQEGHLLTNLSRSVVNR